MTLVAFPRRDVEVVRRDREAARVAADLVQRRKPQVPVERGVLDAFCHHRAGRLLPADHELVALRRALALEQDDAAQVVGKDCSRKPVVVVDATRRGLDVRAVDV